MIKLPIELEDCGNDLLLTFQNYTTYQAEVKVQMVIKAPRGILTLFDRGYISPDTQCEAIRAFMDEHSDGR